MPDWSIKIVAGRNRGDPAVFVPDLDGAQPGDPLIASLNDLVSWNNTTRENHRPWPAGSDFKPLPESAVPRGSALYLSDSIPPDDSSRPSWVVSSPLSGNTLFYCCLLHPEEHGQIVVNT